MRLVFSLLIGLFLFSLTGCTSPRISILVSEKNGISRYSTLAQEEPVVFFKYESREFISNIDSFKNEIFGLARKRIIVFDMKGQILREIELPKQVAHALNFVILPDGYFAILDNQNDKVYFIDPTGVYRRTVNIAEENNKHWQNMNGIVVGNKLVISEDGFKRIVQIGLDDYTVSVFRDFSGVPRVWLGAIAYSNKVYYVAQAKRMYSFRDNNEDPILLAELPESNISGIDICGKTAFVVVNGLSNEGAQKRIGSVYKLDLATGKYEKFIDQLQYPTDIELLYQ